MTDYGNWLLQQTSDRQEASLTHLAVCARLGELQRSAPRSKEAEEMSQQVKDYYARWELREMLR